MAVLRFCNYDEFDVHACRKSSSHSHFLSTFQLSPRRWSLVQKWERSTSIWRWGIFHCVSLVLQRWNAHSKPLKMLGRTYCWTKGLHSEKLTWQIPKLAGKCPVADRYSEHWVCTYLSDLRGTILTEILCTSGNMYPWWHTVRKKCLRVTIAANDCVVTSYYVVT